MIGAGDTAMDASRCSLRLGVECIRTELGEPDESGRRRPVPVPGSQFTMETDTVVIALGTNPNPLVPRTTYGLDVDNHGCIVTDPQTGATSREGVYAGGDIATGAATVILAMGAGRRAATTIHEYLQKQADQEAERAAGEYRNGRGDGITWARDHAPNAVGNFCFEVTLVYRPRTRQLAPSLRPSTGIPH